jgi:hypothetical protein
LQKIKLVGPQVQEEAQANVTSAFSYCNDLVRGIIIVSESRDTFAVDENI